MLSVISIHALREESDLTVNRYSSGHVISIHALREESDTVMSFAPPDGSRFQSTLSVRRATVRTLANWRSTGISIHALREESDLAGKRTEWLFAISIHALREESDRPAQAYRLPSRLISIHALREESDQRLHNVILNVIISIHALREESDKTLRRSS